MEIQLYNAGQVSMIIPHVSSFCVFSHTHNYCSTIYYLNYTYNSFFCGRGKRIQRLVVRSQLAAHHMLKCPRARYWTQWQTATDAALISVRVCECVWTTANLQCKCFSWSKWPDKGHIHIVHLPSISWRLDLISFEKCSISTKLCLKLVCS